MEHSQLLSSPFNSHGLLSAKSLPEPGHWGRWSLYENGSGRIGTFDTELLTFFPELLGLSFDDASKQIVNFVLSQVQGREPSGLPQGWARNLSEPLSGFEEFEGRVFEWTTVFHPGGSRGFVLSHLSSVEFWRQQFEYGGRSRGNFVDGEPLKSNWDLFGLYSDLYLNFGLAQCGWLHKSVQGEIAEVSSFKSGPGWVESQLSAKAIETWISMSPNRASKEFETSLGERGYLQVVSPDLGFWWSFHAGPRQLSLSLEQKILEVIMNRVPSQDLLENFLTSSAQDQPVQSVSEGSFWSIDGGHFIWVEGLGASRGLWFEAWADQLRSLFEVKGRDNLVGSDQRGAWMVLDPARNQVFNFESQRLGQATWTGKILPRSGRSARVDISSWQDEDPTETTLLGRMKELERKMLISDETLQVGRRMEAMNHELKNIWMALNIYLEKIHSKGDGAFGEDLAQIRGLVSRGQDWSSKINPPSRADLSVGPSRVAQLSHRSPANLVREIRELSRFLPRQGREVVWSVSPSIPSFKGSEQFVSTVWRVLQNALEAQSSEGEIEIGINPSEDGKWVRVEIQDSGVGMDPGEVVRALEPLYTSKGAKHLGLGLSFVRSSMADLGGRLRVDSKKGVGTLVTLEFPIKGV